MGLEHEINHEDATVWTAKTTIIKFNTVEMHHSDHDRLRFYMHQQIFSKYPFIQKDLPWLEHPTTLIVWDNIKAT